MKMNILKFNEKQWVLIPPRNTVQEILDIIQNNNYELFKELLEDNFINDNNGQPNVFEVKKIYKKYTDDNILDFELYEIL